MRSAHLVLAALAVPLGATAQLPLQFDPSVPVTRNGQSLDLAWAGGLNAAQFSTIDLNDDGIKDLFIFDRSGNAVLTLLNDGSPGTGGYSITRAYDNVYPFPELHDWVLLRDYNCDGKEDIFAFYQAGFSVFKNISTPGNLAFEMVEQRVESDYVTQSGSVVPSNLYVSSVDLPGVIDVDGDGDLDILTFGVWDASHVEYHKNLSMELYGTCDSLKFELRNKCWGFFAENVNNNSVTLNAPCNYNLPNPEAPVGGGDGPPVAGQAKQNHAGSTVTPLDLNGDGVMDLLLGDIAFPNLVALYNGGDVSLGLMTAIDTTFPSANIPVDQPVYPTAFHLDLDNDGDRDLVVSPSALSLSRNLFSVFYYRNSGGDAAPVFEQQQEDLFQDRMIDLGEGAYPVAFDHDGDGLMDLVVGNYGYYIDPEIGNVGKLALLRNTGTATEPAFEFVTDDYMGLSTSGIGTLMYPAFADVDGDGDQDMYLGDALGRIHFYRNVGTGAEAQFQLAQAIIDDALGNDLDVGQNAAPQFFDVDGDGLLDLLIGERNGNVNYYRNSATAAAPAWTLVEDSVGGVVTAMGFEVTGTSIPRMYLNEDGERQLLVGSESGQVLLYGDIEGNLDGEWTLITDHFLGIREGIRSAPCLVDLTGDGKLDMVLGNQRGGLTFWSSDGDVGLTPSVASTTPGFGLYPNPTNGQVALVLNAPPAKGNTWVVRNSLGQELRRQAALAQRTTMDVSDLPAGLYLVSLEWPGNALVQRLLVAR